MIIWTPKLALVLSLIIPMLGAVLIVLADKSPNRREFVTLATAVLLFLDILYLLFVVIGGARPSVDVLQVIPPLTLAFQIEPLGMLFAVVASGLWIVNSVYSIGYMRGTNEQHQTRFYIVLPWLSAAPSLSHSLPTCSRCLFSTKC